MTHFLAKRFKISWIFLDFWMRKICKLWLTVRKRRLVRVIAQKRRKCIKNSSVGLMRCLNRDQLFPWMNFYQDYRKISREKKWLTVHKQGRNQSQVIKDHWGQILKIAPPSRSCAIQTLCTKMENLWRYKEGILRKGCETTKGDKKGPKLSNYLINSQQFMSK